MPAARLIEPPRAPLCAHQADDGEFVALATKHTFNLGTLGILLGMLGHLQGGWAAGCGCGGKAAACCAVDTPCA